MILVSRLLVPVGVSALLVVIPGLILFHQSLQVLLHLLHKLAEFFNLVFKRFVATLSQEKLPLL